MQNTILICNRSDRNANQFQSAHFLGALKYDSFLLG